MAFSDKLLPAALLSLLLFSSSCAAGAAVSLPAGLASGGVELRLETGRDAVFQALPPLRLDLGDWPGGSGDRVSQKHFRLAALENNGGADPAGTREAPLPPDPAVVAGELIRAPDGPNRLLGGAVEMDNTGLLRPPDPGWGDYLQDTGIAFLGITFAKFLVNDIGEFQIAKGGYEHWWEHLTSKPRWSDGNSIYTNWVGHPAFGAYAYMFMRSRGHGRLASAVSSAALSFAHEILLEGSYEPNSGIDFLVTPGVGVPVGIILDETSTYLVRSESKGWRVVGYCLNPWNLFPWAEWRRDRRFRASMDGLDREPRW